MAELREALRQGLPMDTLQTLVEAEEETMRQQGRRHSDGSSLCLAVQFGRSVEVVQLFVRTGPDSVRERLSDGALALHPAAHAVTCGERSLDVVQYLVEQHPQSVRARAGLGELPLHYAARGYAVSLPVVQFLVEQWPLSVREKAHRGFLPLHSAVYGSDTSSIVDGVRYVVGCWPGSIFERTGDGSLPLHLALASHHPDMATLLLLLEQWPGSIQEAGDRGILPLHLASAVSDTPLDVVYFLASKWPGAVLPRHAPEVTTPFRRYCSTVVENERRS
jgi:Ankyrin repeats (3 copies)